MGSATVSSSSAASSVSASGSLAPPGTGCAYLGDRSFDLLVGESVSDPSDWGSVGGCLASATFLIAGLQCAASIAGGMERT